jgi:molybdopterin molybdotransferase
VQLEEASGRRVVAAVASRLTVPAWDNSAMDGFAVRAADVAGASEATPVELRVAGEVAAGHAPDVSVEPGTAVRILTGAMVPPGADAVVPVEHTDAPSGIAERPDTVAVRAAADAGDHIRRAGSDLHEGDPVLPAGAAIGPAALALLSATGHGSVSVHRRPRVAVLATGDELVPAGEPLEPGQIHDSNSLALAAQARLAGAEVRRLGSAADSLGAVLGALRGAIDWADVVVVSGGVSVGAHDVVKEAFETIGRVELWRVAVQPGKPLAFGRAPRPDGRGEALLFGLPGNPVSSFVTFELFVRPVLRRLAADPDPLGRRTERARLGDPVRKSHGRRAFLRVRLEPDPDRAGGSLARLAGGQGSHVLSALVAADALAVVPEEDDGLPEGAEVEIWRLDAGAGA